MSISQNLLFPRRGLIHLAVTAALLPACLLWSSTIRAQEPFEVFFPLFVELPGWKGNKPLGTAMKMGSSDVVIVSASRQYQRGDTRLNVSVGAMPMKPRLIQPLTTGTGEDKQKRVTLSVIDGWQVASTFGFQDNVVGVHVTLANGYLMLITTKDVAEGDALTLARRFDWKALQATISTFDRGN